MRSALSMIANTLMKEKERVPAHRKKKKEREKRKEGTRVQEEQKETSITVWINILRQLFCNSDFEIMRLNDHLRW